MAVYGADYYGRSKYGGRRRIAYGVEPFFALPTTFNSARIEWHEPGGAWGGFRLVRSRSGFPVNESDGVVLYETTTTTAQGYTDVDLTGGWHYYAIFLLNSERGNWERAGTADVLMPYDYKSTDKLWDLTPEYYKQIRDNGAGFSQSLYQINPAIYLNNQQTVPNEQLISFLHVFGWGFDAIRSQIETIYDGYDTRTMHQSRLALLAQQFGGDVEPSVSATANRNLVRNMSLLYRKRGTLEGLRELLAIATDWDVDVSIGKNLMLSEDQANFVNPQVPWWDPGTRYLPGDRVRYGPNHRYYEALQVAYGLSQAPELTVTANAYWDPDRFVDEPEETVTVNRIDTGDVSTWQVREAGGPPLPEKTFIGAGAYDPVDNTLVNTNALAFKNNTGSTKDFIVRSIPVRKDETALFNKRLTVESAIPIPRPSRKYSSTVTYRAGDMVLYRGAPWEAVTTTLGNLPSDADTTYWKRVGFDSRTRVAMSLYVHGAFNGTINTGGRQTYPHIMAFNESGDLVFDETITPDVLTGIYYDPFNTAGDLTNGRTPATGDAWSGDGVGAWLQDWDDEGGYMYPSAANRTYQLAPPTSANGNVGVTFRSGGNREIGIIFRWSDANNFWIATKSGMHKIVAGAKNHPGSGAEAWADFEPGDRMTVTLNGNTILVKRNGVQVGSATDSFNATATRHGVVAEA